MREGYPDYLTPDEPSLDRKKDPSSEESYIFASTGSAIMSLESSAWNLSDWSAPCVCVCVRAPFFFSRKKRRVMYHSARMGAHPASERQGQRWFGRGMGME